MKEKKIRRIITGIVGMIVVLVAITAQIKKNLPSDVQNNVGNVEKENGSDEEKKFYEIGDIVRLKQYGEDKVYPFEVSVLNVAYEEQLSDVDGYYEDRGIVRKKLEDACKAYQGSVIYHKSDFRYIVVDLKIKRPELTAEEKELLKGEVVYEFQQLTLESILDDDTVDVIPVVHDSADYRILEGNEETYQIKPSIVSEGHQVLDLKEGEEVTIQLVYLVPFTNGSTLYQSCINLTTQAPNSTAVNASYVFCEYAMVSLDLDDYESDYPLSVSEDDTQRKKANRSIQSRAAAEAKAEDSLLNYEIAEMEAENGLPVAEDRLLQEGNTVCDGMADREGNIDKTSTYTAYEDVTGTLYDAIEELPEYFSNSIALQNICQKYVEKGGYAEEDLKFLTVRYTYIYHADNTDNFTIHDLQPVWLYDRKEDGCFYPYGYADDYQILSAETEGNVAHSPYLYLKNDESAVVELVYVIPSDSYRELYITSRNTMLWQSTLDSDYITTFVSVLSRERS